MYVTEKERWISQLEVDLNTKIQDYNDLEEKYNTEKETNLKAMVELNQEKNKENREKRQA